MWVALFAAVALVTFATIYLTVLKGNPASVTLLYIQAEPSDETIRNGTLVFSVVARNPNSMGVFTSLPDLTITLNGTVLETVSFNGTCLTLALEPGQQKTIYEGALGIPQGFQQGSYRLEASTTEESYPSFALDSGVLCPAGHPSAGARVKYVSLPTIVIIDGAGP